MIRFAIGLIISALIVCRHARGSYLSANGGVYSRLTVAIDETVPQEAHCPTLLTKIEVCH